MRSYTATTWFFCAALGGFGCQSLPTPHAGVEVTFPDANHQPAGRPGPKVVQPVSKPLAPVRIQGVPAYYTAWSLPRPIKPDAFNQLKAGLTLMQILSMLGPGYQPACEGVGLIYWNGEDGRVLNVWPKKYQLEEKPHYWLDVRGVDQKHDRVRALALDLIDGIKIKGSKAVIVLTVDAYPAKAGQKKSYQVGDRIQKTEPLPRLDLTINKIDSAGVQCDYFYQAQPDGLVHYRETGSLLLKEKAPTPKAATALPHL